MPILTIIIPVYNAAPYIKEAIDSLLNQTFTDFELWIVNDGSSDNSMNLVSQLNDSRIQLFSNNQNIGRVRTVNQYVKKVSTPFFTITDADDISHPERIQRQLEAFAKDESMMMCGTSYCAMTAKGFVFHEVHLRSDEIEMKKSAHLHSQFMGPTTIMRSEVLDAFPKFYREYFISNQADADLSGRILSEFRTTNLKELLYFYRIVPSSVSRKTVTMWNLNVYKLIGCLYWQRKQGEKDWLELGHTNKADDFMKSIVSKYESDLSFLPRHTAFFHLYWGQTQLAISQAWKAFSIKPLKLKNSVSLALIILRSGLFYLNRMFNKTHYSEWMKHTK